MIDIIINTDTEVAALSQESKILATQYHPVLNCLYSLGFDSQYPPAADFVRQCLGLEQGAYLLASPIRWLVTHNDAMITTMGSALHFSDTDSHLLFTEVQPLLQEVGIELIGYDASMWLMRVDDVPPINSPSPACILNQSLIPYLKGLDQQLFWQKLFTEIQMLCVHQDGNLQTMVNGLWFYGAGKFQAHAEHIIFTNNTNLCRSLPMQFQALTDHIQLGKRASILLHPHENLPYLPSLLKGHTVRWFWNNIAYVEYKENWWQRLKRSFNVN